MKELKLLSREIAMLYQKIYFFKDMLQHTSGTKERDKIIKAIGFVNTDIYKLDNRIDYIIRDYGMNKFSYNKVYKT